MKRKLILSLLAMLLPISAWCADGDKFSVTVESITFWFSVLSEDSKTVQLFNDNKAAVENPTTTVTIPSSVENEANTYTVTQIGQRAFQNVSGVNEIILPSTITKLDNNAFQNCSNLQKLEIPAGVTNIGKTVFSNCRNLKTLSVASGNSTYDSRDNCNAIIQTSSNTLIQGCAGTTTIPGSVWTIGQNAFNGLNLTEITISDGVQTIESNAFNSNNINNLVLPSSISSIAPAAFPNCYINVTITDNAIYEAIGNCIIEKGSKTLIAAGKNVSAIPEGVITIGQQAFQNASSSTLSFSSTVKQISGRAFQNCKSTTITLNEGLETIQGNAFQQCSNLNSILIPTTVKSIGSNAFVDAGKNSNSFTLELPYTLTSIAASSVFGTTNTYPTISYYVKPAKEYTSFACPQDVDFSGATGLKAYVASGFDASAKKVSLKEVTSAKAGEGIIIQATAGTKYDLALATAADNGTNLLVGVTTDTAIEPTDGSNTNFLLSDGQFKKAQAGTLANGKAYLQLPTSAAARAKSLGITTEGDVTGIININLDEEDDGMIYDLNGRRISETATKGIYVKNGKKVIIK